MKQVPTPTVERLAGLYTILERLEKEDREYVSSKEIGELTGISSYTVRKDVNYLSYAGTEAGYGVKALKQSLVDFFGLGIKRKACIVGMGRLGRALLDYGRISGGNIEIVAGFDSSINVLETTDADIPLYPARDIPEIVSSLGIELAIIAVPPEAAALTAERLIKGGIRGIINFTPAPIKTVCGDVAVNNFDLMDEFRILNIFIDRKERE